MLAACIRAPASNSELTTFTDQSFAGDTSVPTGTGLDWLLPAATVGGGDVSPGAGADGAGPASVFLAPPPTATAIVDNTMNATNKPPHASNVTASFEVFLRGGTGGGIWGGGGGLDGYMNFLSANVAVATTKG
jgi:hypothetical protein